MLSITFNWAIYEVMKVLLKPDDAEESILYGHLSMAFELPLLLILRWFCRDREQTATHMKVPTSTSCGLAIVSYLCGLFFPSRF
jgi:cytochrome b561